MRFETESRSDKMLSVNALVCPHSSRQRIMDKRPSLRLDNELIRNYPKLAVNEVPSPVDPEDLLIAEQIEALRKRLSASKKYKNFSKLVLNNKLDELERTMSMLGAVDSRSSECALSDVHRDRLTHCREVIVVNMAMNADMYSSLIEDKVLSPDLAEEIKSLGTRRRQCEAVIDLLVLLGDQAYMSFLKALSKTDQDFIVDILMSDPVMKTPCYCEDFTFEISNSTKSDVLTLPVSRYPKSGTPLLLDIFAKSGEKFRKIDGVPQRQMSDIFCKALIKNHVRLCRELFAEILFDSLVEDEILTSDVTEGLFMIGSRHRMNQVLLHILPLFSDDAFVSFVAALKKTGQDHLAILLEDYVATHASRS